jgi:hypothetical protein
MLKTLLSAAMLAILPSQPGTADFTFSVKSK